MTVGTRLCILFSRPPSASHSSIQFHPPSASPSSIQFHRSFYSTALQIRKSHTISLLNSKLSYTPSASPSYPGQVGEGDSTEDSKFVPLTAEDPVYGPPALLLVGFKPEDATPIRHLLKELEGEFLQIIFCTEDMIEKSLWEAVHERQSNFSTLEIASCPSRICFLSGLTGEETMMLIDAFPESGLEPPVFAALVPNSSKKPVSELIEEIMADHEMMTSRQQSVS